jgi:hypothetical protein
MLHDVKEAASAERALNGLEVNPYQARILELEQEVAQLREALVHRQQYGIVTGLLAARFGLTPEHAWRLLVRLSQHSNLKMRVVSRVIHDRFFDRLSPADKPLAAQLDAQLRGTLGSLRSVELDPGKTGA